MLLSLKDGDFLLVYKLAIAELVKLRFILWEN